MTIYPKISMIVAQAGNGIIGRNGGLPWRRLSSDLGFFKKTTLGKPVLMGRVTWESLPSPLPGRTNLVLTRQKNYRCDGAEVFHDLSQMLDRAFEIAREIGVDEIMIIGGASLYAAMMPRSERLYVTDVDAEVEGDVVFPPIDGDIWTRVDTGEKIKAPRDDHALSILIYERKAASDG
ncbi:MAG: dihydrofolate reductase [Hyphomonadaceae bacterium]|nr:dihydrofolate reductase [Hyphomonadaceae bacterium]